MKRSGWRSYGDDLEFAGRQLENGCASIMKSNTRNRFSHLNLYERKGEKLLPFPHFLGRVGYSLLLALGLAGVALLLGTLGYHYIAGLDWIDGELNAAMILTGMGPVDPMRSTAPKIFASVYALFSGVVFLTSVGIVLAPVVHRIVHKFHLNDREEQ